MSISSGWKVRFFLWSSCFLIAGLVGTPHAAAQDPTAQTAVNNIEALGVVPVTQPLTGLGFNIDTTDEWEFSLAASAGTTHVRFQCSWAETEAQTAPPMNASAGYALSPNCAKALAFSKKYGMHPTVIAAFGAPFHQILTVSVPSGAAAGTNVLSVQFAGGIGGDTVASLAAFSDAIISSNGNQLSSRNSYAGDLITSVNQTDATHATLTLASALTSGLPADSTSTYTINEYLYPPAATSGANDPSVTAYTNYARFLAQSIAASGMTGEVEIWNEPPWSSDPWDVRQNFYDAFPGPGFPGPIAGNQPNWGFAAALSKAAYAVSGVPYVWAGTNKSADNSLLASGMILNTGSLFVQPVTNVKTESIHPYGNNPEDDIWSETCVKNSILPNPLKPLYFTRCNLDSNSTSNVVELEQLNLIAKLLNPSAGIAHSITETGFSLSGGDLAHEARFVMRQFLAYQAIGVTPVEFYRLYDTSPDDLTFTDLSTHAPLPAFTAISGLMADLASIKGAPVVAANAANLSSIVSYGGFFALDTLSIVGSRPGDKANSQVLVVWQRSHVTGSAKWATMASPTAVPVTIAIPRGSLAVSVVNLDTRAAVAFTANGQQITFAVSDDPIEVLIEPSSPVGPTVTSISITPATASVVVGAVLNFACTATLSDGTTTACASPVYTSSNPGLASVSSNAVTGLAPGSLTITVSVAGVPSASAPLSVTAPPAPTVSSIAIMPATASVVVGATFSFSCTATFSDGTTSICASAVYNTSNPSVASDVGSAVTGVAPGSATITVSVSGAPSASASLTVTAPAVTVTSISIAPGTASIPEGAALDFICTAKLSSGATAACASPVYSSSDPGVVSVSSNAVTGVAPGSATVTASVAGVTQPASALVTVTPPATTSGLLTASPATGATYGLPLLLTETVLPQGGACPDSSFSFSSGGVLLGIAKLVGTTPSAPTSCTATISTTALPVGSDLIAATAQAEGASGAVSSMATVNIAPRPGTGDTLSVGPVNTTVGSPVTVVFRMPGIPGAAVPASGSVLFSSNGRPLGTVMLSTTGSGTSAVTTATFVTSSLAIGTDVIAGVYAGDQNYGSAAPTAVANVSDKTKGPPATAATITVSGLARTYNGQAQGVAVATLPAGIAYEVTYNGSAQIPTEAGSYAIIAKIVDASYSAQPATGTLVIAKERSKLSWAPYTTVSSPDRSIGANVLDAQCSVKGDVTYTATSSTSQTVPVTSTSFLPAGQYTLTGLCNPSDDADYASSSESVSFSIVNDSIFVSNLSGEVAEFFSNGTPQGQNAAGGGLGIAVDPSGNVWSINSAGNTVSKFDKTGTRLSVSAGGGLDSAKALAIDDAGRVWVVNDAGTVSSLRSDGTPASVAAYASPALDNPSSVSVDFKGSIWVANGSSNSVTEIVGVAAPTVTPIISGQTQH